MELDRVPALTSFSEGFGRLCQIRATSIQILLWICKLIQHVEQQGKFAKLWSLVGLFQILRLADDNPLQLVIDHENIDTAIISAVVRGGFNSL